MTFDSRHAIDDGLQHLAARLDPIIAATLAPDLHGLPWTAVLTELDEMRGKPPRTYATTDLQAQLRVITERLGNLGFPFEDNTHLVTALGSELRIMRNRWAHNDELTTLDAWRAHDFVVRLLERFKDTVGVRRARDLREEAFDALVAEKGVATHVATPIADAGAAAVAVPAPALELVAPDLSVLTRTGPGETQTIGAARDPFEPWRVVLVGEASVLDELPRKAAKGKVRAVAAEIAEFEGPIHLDRLVQLTAASFGVRRLRSAREKKLTYQIRQTGLLVDRDKFVWPTDLDPKTWLEFRPNDSTLDRPLIQVSPVEIANAMRFIQAQRPGLDSDDLDRATLQTFGRKRRTRQLAEHLARARELL